MSDGHEVRISRRGDFVWWRGQIHINDLMSTSPLGEVTLCGGILCTSHLVKFFTP